MSYNLGLDIGIASVGFAGVDLEQNKILFSGSHIFEAAENPKDGSSLATNRREKRGLRRTTSRKAQRKHRIRNLLKKYGFENSDIQTIDQSTQKGVVLSPWDLRKAALERKLTNAEFARVLFHIAKHRGFQSNKIEGANTNDTEGKKVLEGAVKLEEKAVSAPTVAAYLATKPKQRNSTGNYSNSIKRDELRHEIKLIFKAQADFGNLLATQDLLDEYAGSGKKEERNTLEGDGIAFFQKPIQSSEGLVGECTFEKKEKRAPKFSYSAELFVLWSKLNNIRIKSLEGQEQELTQQQKQMIVELAHKNKSGVSYKQARKALDLTDDERFNISYRRIKDGDNSWEKVRDTTEKTVFVKLAGSHALKEALAPNSQVDWQNWVHNRREDLDNIARILSFYKDKKEVDEKLSSYNLTAEQKQKLSQITNFSKTVNLSLVAIYKILPLLEEGKRYDEACAKIWGDHRLTESPEHNLVPPFDDVANPVVNRALAQTRKVINACIRKYGKPKKIIVELARDVGKSFKDRKDIEREQKNNEAHRNAAREHIAEILGIPVDNVNGEQILKYRLWQEQRGFCIYSGEYISPEMLRDSTATQIDHILPYSRSWNNSYMNKVLCITDENQNKGNKTPYEYLSEARFAILETEARKLPPQKAENLLNKTFDSRDKGWQQRALNDTRYMARLLQNHLANNLNLGESKHVQARNGALTANLRGAWGFAAKNRHNDRHHALDAIVLACSTQDQVQRFAQWNKYAARKRHPSERPHAPQPWENFRNDAMDAVFGKKNQSGIREGGIFVTRMPVRKVTGAAHQETIRSIRSDGKIVQRVKLRSLTKSNAMTILKHMVDKQRNSKLYNLLKTRLEAYDGKPDKAFAEPVYMPVNDPAKTAPRVDSIRIETTEKSGVKINHGLASNGSMVRVDVFRVNNKFMLVPIYAHQFAEPKLPNKAILRNKEEANWQPVEDKDFLFSLYKNDLVHIKTKKEDLWGYYSGADRSDGRIKLVSHDSGAFPDITQNSVKEADIKKLSQKRINLSTIEIFEKYSVNYFAEKFQIKKETRCGVAQYNDSESSQAVLE